MDNDRQTHRDIETVAYALWQGEGKPSGRAQSHWDAAREIVATREAGDRALLPVRDEREAVEPSLAWDNQAVAPGLTDQAEADIAPRRGR